MIELRDYQQDLLERSQTALAPEGARVMTQLPTGGGKTEIAGALLKDFLVDGRKAVWLTHREELAEQTEERLSLNWSVSAMSGTDSWSPRRPAPRIVNGVVILKAQTVSRRNKDSLVVWNNFGPDDLLVIDEAHHAPATGWERAIKQWPGRVWGLTATPWRLSRSEGFDHLFDTLVTGPQTAKMQAKRYLARSRVFAPTPDDRISGGEVGRLGDFTEGGIANANDGDGDGGHFIMTTLAVNFWLNNAAGRPTVAYAVSKGHADNLVREFTGKGISAAAILSDTPQANRERAITDFRNGNLKVLVNVAVATEGFDLPDASCVMITRPTKSLALYLQMVGRGLRPKEDGGDCLILDLAGNAEEHGLPEAEREWSLAARGNPVAGDPPVRYCHECNYMAHPAHHNCPECDADLGKHCTLCGKFRPWSRWTTDCPIEHEEVCDYCDPDFHRGGRYDPKLDGQSYANRAKELGDQRDFEGALVEWTFAIHSARTKGRVDWNFYINCMGRAKVHAEMGNVELAEADFAEAEAICEGEPTSGDPRTALLSQFHDERANMYESRGRHKEAELYRKKAKDLREKFWPAITQPRIDIASAQSKRTRQAPSGEDNRNEDRSERHR